MGIYLPNMEMPKDIEPGLVIEFADGIDGKRYARLWHYRHGGLTEWLEAVSTADVWPVVLCKDCMYAPSGTDDGEDRGFALEWPHDEWPEDNPCPYKCDDGWYSHKPKPDFFCANGKEEDSE